ncbi:MAG: hypothetical protein J5936_04010, partial [Acholeplasmatales bacterium]|nr:hypothetical protein [Acholeplasmatales bacterium]
MANITTEDIFNNIQLEHNGNNLFPILQYYIDESNYGHFDLGFDLNALAPYNYFMLVGNRYDDEYLTPTYKSIITGDNTYTIARIGRNGNLYITSDRGCADDTHYGCIDQCPEKSANNYLSGHYWVYCPPVRTNVKNVAFGYKWLAMQYNDYKVELIYIDANGDRQTIWLDGVQHFANTHGIFVDHTHRLVYGYHDKGNTPMSQFDPDPISIETLVGTSLSTFHSNSNVLFVCKTAFIEYDYNSIMNKYGFNSYAWVDASGNLNMVGWHNHSVSGIATNVGMLYGVVSGVVFYTKKNDTAVYLATYPAEIRIYEHANENENNLAFKYTVRVENGSRIDLVTNAVGWGAWVNNLGDYAYFLKPSRIVELNETTPNNMSIKSSFGRMGALFYTPDKKLYVWYYGHIFNEVTKMHYSQLNYLDRLISNSEQTQRIFYMWTNISAESGDIIYDRITNKVTPEGNVVNYVTEVKF